MNACQEEGNKGDIRAGFTLLFFIMFYVKNEATHFEEYRGVLYGPWKVWYK